MNKHLLQRLRWGAFVTVLGTSVGCAWAQPEQIASRIERLQPTQQRQLQTLMASRQEGDIARLFTDEEVRAVRTTVPITTAPLPQEDVKQLSLRINEAFGMRGNYIDRVVNTEEPAFPVCPDCNDGLDKTCHDPLLQSRRATASTLLTQHPHLSEAVGGLYLVQAGGEPQLMGTIFVLQGRLVTSGHVLLDKTEPVGSPDVRKLKSGRRLEAVFGGGGARRVALPVDATWRRHPNLDLILTTWPAGTNAPAELTLATDPPSTNTPVALLGFPWVNTNTDRPQDIDRAFGRCPESQALEPRMVISMGRIVSVTGAALEHDANTMGDSSGSPLIRIADGKLVGVHRGDALSSVRNSAVAASSLSDLITAAAP